MGRRAERSDAAVAAPTVRSRRPAAAHLGRCALALLAVVLLGCVTFGVASSSAEVARHHHVGTIKATSKCPLGEPTGVAVNEATGDIYVIDALSKRLERFSSAGACLEELPVGEAGAVAVDNSKEPSDPSKGDVYVATVNEELAEGIFFVNKYTSGELHAIDKIKRFQTEPKGPFEFFEEPILGLGIDGNGGLWIDDGEKVFGFDNQEKNGFSTTVEDGGNCAAARGFAVTSDAREFFVARERENRKEECEGAVVMVELAVSEGIAEPVNEFAYKSQLDNANTTGVALDPVDSTLYFDNEQSVAAYTLGGRFLERFGEELHLGSGIAVDHATNDVYVPDAAEEAVQVYGPAPVEPHPPEPAPADGRRYEMVSPPNKHGGAIFGITTLHGVVQASADGNAIAYTSNEPLVSEVPTNRAPEPAMSMSRRGASVWETESLATPHPEVPNGSNGVTGSEWEFFSEDLRAGYTDPAQHGSGAQEKLAPETSEETAYRSNLATPRSGCLPVPSACYQALVSPLDVAGEPPPQFGGKTVFITATPDGTKAILRSQVALTTEASAGEGLYEWSYTSTPGGALRLVSALPADEASEQVVSPSVGALNTAGNATAGVFRNAVSGDGSRVIWGWAPDNTGKDVETEPGASALYVRDFAKGETIRLDAAHGVPQPGVVGARFMAASAKDERIFFTDTQPLTPDATTPAVEAAEELEQEPGLGDLYVCEVIEEAGGELGCKLTDLTASVTAPGVELAAVQGVPAAGNEGTVVYYVADGELNPKAGRGDCTEISSAQTQQEEREGKIPLQTCALYVSRLIGGKWSAPHPIAVLTGEDRHDWQIPTSALSSAILGGVTSGASPDGNYFAFMSNSSLTGYDNVDAISHQPDEEVFLYKADEEELSCASCNPSGNPPNGVHDIEESGEGPGLVIDRPLNWAGGWLAANIPGWSARSNEAALHQPRYLSDSGRLFFNSADPLVPADVNGNKADVYEFEPKGVGSCTSPTGCVSLMSSGESLQESALLDASDGGESVFFMTSQRLIPEQDTDSGFDIYDARECGNSPCLSPPPKPPPGCTGEEPCKGPVTTVPALGPIPASTTLPGAGNSGKRTVIGGGATSGGKNGGSSGPTRKQLLAKALKKCKRLKKKKKKKRRVSCERQARRKYGAGKKAGTSKRRATKGRSR